MVFKCHYVQRREKTNKQTSVHLDNSYKYEAAGCRKRLTELQRLIIVYGNPDPSSKSPFVEPLPPNKSQSAFWVVLQMFVEIIQTACLYICSDRLNHLCDYLQLKRNRNDKKVITSHFSCCKVSNSTKSVLFNVFASQKLDEHNSYSQKANNDES